MAGNSNKRRKQADRKVRGRTSRSQAADDLARIALNLFAEHHYASVTIKDIGRAAKVNTAMIYYYYADKRALFRAAIESAIDEAFLLFANHCNSEKYESPADAISAWFDVHVTLHKQLRNVVKISIDCKGVVGSVPETNEPIKRFYRHESEILQNIIREGIERKIFRRVDPLAVATMISTSLDGVLARSFFLKDFDMLRTVEEFKQALWKHLGYSVSLPKAVRVARSAGVGRKSTE